MDFFQASSLEAISGMFLAKAFTSEYVFMKAKKKIGDTIGVKLHPQMSNPDICLAVSDRRRLYFEYHGEERIVEPQCYGITKAGKESVRCHMIEGGSREEQLFELSKMEGFKLLDERFSKPGPNYVKGDSAFKIIFCEL
jgi:hypothetical protein